MKTVIAKVNLEYLAQLLSLPPGARIARIEVPYDSHGEAHIVVEGMGSADVKPGEAIPYARGMVYPDDDLLSVPKIRWEA